MHVTLRDVTVQGGYSTIGFAEGADVDIELDLDGVRVSGTSGPAFDIPRGVINVIGPVEIEEDQQDQ